MDSFMNAPVERCICVNLRFHGCGSALGGLCPEAFDRDLQFPVFKMGDLKTPGKVDESVARQIF